MKLWQRDSSALSPLIEAFTVGDDYLLDRRLVKYDCLGSQAHAKVLHRAGVLEQEELVALTEGLDEIAALADKGQFEIRPEDEDCHTAIENYLTNKLGDVGQKIHTGRSRNDQVLTALRLYEKDVLKEMEQRLSDIQKAIRALIRKQGHIEMPGYTHTQRAMPTTVGMWLDSFVELFDADLILVQGAHEIIDASPLGTAAGFGVPVLELDRDLAKEILGFSRLLNNPIAAQNGRGKWESILLGACSQIAFTLNKLATDLILFNTAEFGFVELDPSICTGSSIMPQKKNPDVFELVRAKYHVVLAEEFKMRSIIGNLVSGYHRDFQLTKGPLFSGIDTAMDCIHAMQYAMDRITFVPSRCKKALTSELYATKCAYELVQRGTPFREAYRVVAQNIKSSNEEDNQ